MSEAWLRSHDVDFDRYDSWRDISLAAYRETVQLTLVSSIVADHSRTSVGLRVRELELLGSWSLGVRSTLRTAGSISTR